MKSSVISCHDSSSIHRLFRCVYHSIRTCVSLVSSVVQSSRYLAPWLILSALVVPAHAGVYLSATSFTSNNLPYVWTDEAMPTYYKLRVKISGGAGGDFHAANAFNNSWTRLDSCPIPGSYHVDLYWIKYDSTGTNIVQIGPMTGYSVMINGPDTAVSPIATAVFGYVGQFKQDYVVPPNANCVAITAWGGGGSASNGGNGGCVTAMYNITAGQHFAITIASGGAPSNPGWPGGGTGSISTGGGYTRVETPLGEVWAGGGGGGGSGGTIPTLLLGGDGGGVGTGNGWTSFSASGGTQTGPGLNSFPGAAGKGGDSTQGAGGGGAGYYGGGGGGVTWQNSTYWFSGGGGGSSIATGTAYAVRYTVAKNGGQADGYGKGGSGGVIIRAFQISGPSLPVSYSQTWQADQRIAFPSSTAAAYVVVKMWGGGGGGSTVAAGGAGAYVMAIYPAPSSLLTLTGPTAEGNVWWHGHGRGGNVARVRSESAAGLFIAGGGGGAGTAVGGGGGVGGAPNGGDGGGGLHGSGGHGGTFNLSAATGYGGPGGQGSGTSRYYDDDGNEIGSDDVGDGQPADDVSNALWWTSGGDPGDGGDTNTSYVFGGVGGSGYAGGGGGGSSGDPEDPNCVGGGGGGGGASAAINASGMTYLMLAGTGAVPAGTNDRDYPGNNVGAGGLNGAYGGPGAIVLVAYPAGGSAPAITASLAQSVGQNHVSDIALTASNSPLFYTATNLPPGLTLDRISGHVIGTPTTTGTFSSTFSATNPYGTGQATIVWTVTAPDSTVPSTPTNVQATATSLSALTLTWSASTDNVSIYAYEVQQDNVTIAVQTGTSLAVSNLTAGSTHTYKVRARDPAYNWSAWSSSVTITLTDQIAPSAPAALNYADATATTITLVWNASSDNVGVTGYNIYRGGELIGASSDPTFTDTGLTASTAYSYTVKALDAAGNLSAASATLNVTTTQDFSADSDHDGLPNTAESALGTNTSTAASADTTNQTQQNIHRPTK